MFVLILIPQSGVSCPVIVTKLEADDANTTHGADINLDDRTFFKKNYFCGNQNSKPNLV